MNRRGFLKTLGAGVYSVALPLPALVGGVEVSEWDFTIKSVEVIGPLESTFGMAVRGLAVLNKRPDMACAFAFKVDPDRISPEYVDEVVDTQMKPIIRDHFRAKLEAELA